MKKCLCAFQLQVPEMCNSLRRFRIAKVCFYNFFLLQRSSDELYSSCQQKLHVVTLQQKKIVETNLGDSESP